MANLDDTQRHDELFMSGATKNAGLASSEDQSVSRKTAGLWRTNYFWLVVFTVVCAVIFSNAPKISVLIDLPVYFYGQYTFYIAMYRFFYLVSIAITAWRFGIKWGLIICLALGAVTLPAAIANPWIPNDWIDIVVVAIGIIFAWLIGLQGNVYKLQKETAGQLKRQTVKLNLEIEERKRVEAEIRESERRYRLLAENASDVIWTVNIDNPERLTYISPSVTRLLGYSVEEAQMKGMAEVYTRASYEILMQALAEELAAEISGLKDPLRYRMVDVEMVRRDGKTIAVEIKSSFIRDDNGQAVGILTTARDISERKQMEKQLIMTNKLASIGELASGIAHELNNPMTSIIGFAQLIGRKEIPADLKEDLDVISREAQRAAGIVKNLLTFARKNEMVKQMSQINDIIDEVLKLRSYEQKTSNIEVVTRLSSTIPEIMIDYAQIQQVFLNIVINAENAMIDEHNGGTLTITTEEDNGYVRVLFADDGPGIASENLSRVFDPFFTTKEKGKGTGLGLSICHGIIHKHNGRIYVESGPGKGATFIVELPVIVIDQK